MIRRYRDGDKGGDASSLPPRFRKSVRLGIVYPYLRDEKTTF